MSVNNLPNFSVVCPVFRTKDQLIELVDRLDAVFKRMGETFELILVDDGCPDDSWASITALKQEKPFVKGVKLSRNFGQHYAITAGLDEVKGQWIVVMDADLQDLPEEIVNLYQKAKEGYDVVLAQRAGRKDQLFKKWSSILFYKALSFLAKSSQDHRVANFGIYHRKVVDQIQKLRERVRYFPAMVQWVGFRQAKIPVQHGEGEGRASAYDFGRRVDLALDILLAYSDRPLRMTVRLGAVVALTGFLYAIYTLIKYLLGEITVMGYASLLISIWVLTGLILITLGVVGLYVGKTYEGVKGRPIYIVEERI